MRLITAVSFLPLALAAPFDLVPKTLPDHTPVNVPNKDDFDVNCGGTTIVAQDIVNAVSWGTNLQRAGQTVGNNKYPHLYGNSEDFEWADPACDSNSRNRELFPVIKGGTYDGTEGIGRRFRVIYVHDPNSQTDSQGNPTATYCGTIYHADHSNDFKGCDVVQRS
ncbi:hypothetical protein GGS20DRAFT_588921 [Poronia punctata]|nr:hypothetical protein GGS20DRAFT_588921 [Poronia punctata]